MNKRFYPNAPIVYQLYLPSFLDTNNDGVGDFGGVIRKVDYLSKIGVTHLWLSPFNVSPMHDNGYDVADFYKVAPRYGAFADLKKLILKANNSGIGVLMDIVFNHTSNEHEWFKRATSSRNNAFQDYYWFFEEDDPIVMSLKDVKSVFNEPILVHVPKIKKYYYATFSKYQPDLNWDNPMLRIELKKVIDYWLEQGIAGFRFDVFNMIVKTRAKMLSQTSPWDHAEHDKVLQYWREVLASCKNVFTVAECNVSAERALRYTDAKTGVVSSVFSFDHFDERDFKTNQSFRFDAIVKAFFVKATLVNNDGGRIALTFNNHDNPRLIDWASQRFPNYAGRIAKIMEVLLIFNSSVPFVYQGDEFALANPQFKSVSELVDLASKNELGVKSDDLIIASSRDNARVPLSWNEKAPNFGFSLARPWLTNKYAKQFADRDFSETLVTLINLRKKHFGSKNLPMAVIKLTTTYFEYTVGNFVIAINFSQRVRRIGSKGVLVHSTNRKSQDQLAPFEAKIWRN